MSIALGSGVLAASQHPEWWATLASWGNIGSLLGGLAAVCLGIVAVITGTAGLGDWRARQRAQRDLANEEAEGIRLDRQRVLYGWSPGGMECYTVKLITQPEELAQAAAQLSERAGSDYVVVKVNERAEGNENRANDLRNMIERTGYVARLPGPGEYEALLVGRRVLLEQQGAESSHQ